MKTILIKKMNADDLAQAAEIHQEIFSRQSRSFEWLDCTLKAFPRMLCFVAIEQNRIEGYIIWAQKSGFRPEAVIELDQIAVKQTSQRKGIGKALIEQSLPLVRRQLATLDTQLKHVIVTTRADNYAQSLYKKTLGAEVEATISNLYSADEVIMIARNI